MDHRIANTCPSFVDEEDMDQEMDFEMSSPGAYSDILHTQHNSHGQPIYLDHNTYGEPALRCATATKRAHHKTDRLTQDFLFTF
jgi:hypothetical protein